ncbi:hypothetical protein N1027_07005 [Herbiconiux sp. CPCC 205763]|uniref:Uncharacterized protein n=1 Tax=Herbiconiux aconitum TaxID=2970913 RepID=A0ABT2GNT9_9MICO|nr:hypothetical protein [Herbiconiux aconitum]MCS5717881.1 hypothetical protein [Herbiconiux aconitum]
MTSETSPTPADLTGTPDERTRRLAHLVDAPSAEWLRRQLEAALRDWAADESELDIIKESRADY